MALTDTDALDRFLAEPRNAIVVGLGRDGTARSTPNWFVWDGGRFYVSTTRSRAKYRIFRRNPRVQLVVDDSTGFRYVVVDGTVEIDEDVDRGIVWFERLRAEHGRGGASRQELREEMERDGRVTLVITPDRPPTDWLALGF